jgi:hydrogenase maturation protease
MRPRVLVAGIGNVFLSDDGFGVEVLRELDRTGLPPGTLSLTSATDTHDLHGDAVFRLLRLLGGDAGRVLVLTCEPACVDGGIGLSPQVQAAVPAAVRAVTELAWGASPELPVQEPTEV